MYDELIKELRNKHRAYVLTGNEKPGKIFAEAADAIEELSRKYIEERNAAVELTGELASKPRWIPVAERLPEFEGCLLCMRKAFVGDKLRYQDILYYEEGTFYMEFEDTPIPAEVITHWMPLPEPPTAEEE